MHKSGFMDVIILLKIIEAWETSSRTFSITIAQFLRLDKISYYSTVILLDPIASISKK